MGFNLGKSLGISGGGTGAALGAAAGFMFGGPAGAAGGAQLGGSLGNMLGQESANEKNIDLANRQMQFQADMSNTAHQREVKDLIAAGLNPNLSAGGNGSSTPSGASAVVQAPQISMPDFLAYGMSLKQLELKEKELGLKTAETATDIAKKTSEKELTQAKKILAQKGMLAADLEGETASVVKKMIKFLKDGVQKQQQPNFNYRSNRTNENFNMESP